MNIKHMKDETFGYWKVLEFSHIDERGVVYWKCQCLLCGKVKAVRGDNLRRGTSTKCIKCAAKLRARKK